MTDSLTNDGRTDLDVLAEEYLARRAKGEQVTAEDYVINHPDLAAEILEVFPALEALKSFSTEWKKNVIEHNRAGLNLPFQLGEYRLDREIGRGGMGTVYEAVHTSLQRRVAVKILRTFSLNTDIEIKRFHDEAQAAARLHHTNIVPVFDFGEEEGFYYIAMQLIQGDALDVVIDRFKCHKDLETKGDERLLGIQHGSTHYWQKVATIGIQAAKALAYAHSQGTTHRDIKPANLLLDENENIWVADFGLARQDDEGQPTQSGVLSGTLRYLAPEHFHGQCDERTDQYGLGLTLYELATLQPATGEDGSHGEIVRRITESKIATPRQLKPKIPRDLETIILKSIAANPDDRFSSCEALAEDLSCFEEGRPIHSRPIKWFERLWRWAKRYPALASAITTSAALVLLVALVASLGYQAEYKQRQRAEATSAYAIEALDTVFDRFAITLPSGEFTNDVSTATPVLSNESAQMLEGLLPIFDRLSEMDDQSFEVRLRATIARKRVGDIQLRLGQLEEAIQSYGNAAARYLEFKEGDVESHSIRIAEIYNSIGTCEIMLGRINESHASHARALKQLKPFTESTTEEIIYQFARTHFLLARRLRPGESPNSPQDAPRRRPPFNFGPSSGYARPEFPQPENHHLLNAIELIESLDQPSPRCRHLLAMCLKGLVSDQFSRRNESQWSSEKQAIQILEQLMKDYPTVAEYRHSYVSLLASIDTRHPGSISVADLPAAKSRIQQAVTRSEKLVASHPYVPDYTLTLIHAQNKLAHILERQSMAVAQSEAKVLLMDALKAYQSAENLQTELIERFPDADAYKSWQQEFERSSHRLREQIKKL